MATDTTTSANMNMHESSLASSHMHTNTHADTDTHEAELRIAQLRDSIFGVIFGHALGDSMGVVTQYSGRRAQFPYAEPICDNIAINYWSDMTEELISTLNKAKIDNTPHGGEPSMDVNNININNISIAPIIESNYAFMDTITDATLQIHYNFIANIIRGLSTPDEVNHLLMTSVRGRSATMDTWAKTSYTQAIGNLDSTQSIMYSMWALQIIKKSLIYQKKPNFRKILLLVADQRGSSVVNCALVGSIIGGHIGYSNLPKKLLTAMPDHDWLYSQIEEYLDEKTTLSVVN